MSGAGGSAATPFHPFDSDTRAAWGRRVLLPRGRSSGLAIVLATPGFRLAWEHANDFAVQARAAASSAFGARGSGERSPRRSGGSFTGTVVKDLESGVDYFVSVKAGDDGNRCSPFTPRLVARASKGNKPFSGLRFELQKLEVAIRRFPCSHVSGRPCRRHQPPSLSGARLGALPTATPERGDWLGGPP